MCPSNAKACVSNGSAQADDSKSSARYNTQQYIIIVNNIEQNSRFLIALSYRVHVGVNITAGVVGAHEQTTAQARRGALAAVADGKEEL